MRSYLFGIQFLAMITLLLVSCSGEEDNGQSDDCSQIVETFQTIEARQEIVAPQAQNYEDCIPDKVAAQSDAKELFLTMMEFYLGDYRDEFDNVYTLQCTQDGTWTMPGNTPDGARCAGGWGMPIRIVSEEQNIQVPGTILLGGGTVETSGASLDFCLPNNDCRFGYHIKNENGDAWKWVFYENKGEWVKE